jgi:hypothetical protein
MPSRTESNTSVVAVLLGAQKFPLHKQLDNPAFGRSNDAIRRYLQDELSLRAEQILDLFDDPGSLIDLDDRISAFLSRTLYVKNILIFYTGHGGFLSDREYYLAISTTRKGREHITGLRIKAFAETLSEFTYDRNLFLILDCCFAGDAVKEFQSPELTKLVETKTFDALPEAGTSMLVAASKDEPAISPSNNQYTMFSEIFLDVLDHGIPRKPAKLTLREVAVRTQSLIRARYGQLAVHPEIHSPRQKGLDAAEIRIFPNRARNGALRADLGRADRAGSSTKHPELEQLSELENRFPVSSNILSRDFIAALSDCFVDNETALGILDEANQRLRDLDPGAILIRRGNIILRSTPFELWQSLFNEAALQGHRTVTALLLTLLAQQPADDARELIASAIPQVLRDYHMARGDV